MKMKALTDLARTIRSKNAGYYNTHEMNGIFSKSNHISYYFC
jgi:hypothetical protein